MAGNSKKRRKVYRPKAAHLPMMAETHDRLALSLHLTVEALITDPSPLAYNELSKKIAALTDSVSYLRGGRNLVDDRDAAANAIRTCVVVLVAVWDRWEAAGKVMVTASEAISLRNAAGALDNEMAKIPKNVLDACMWRARAKANSIVPEGA